VASDARTDGLGIQREYLEDYILFRVFPTVAARYQNLVTASLGTRSSGDRSVGVIGSGENTSYGTFAVYLNDLGNDAQQDAQIDVTWAKQFSGAAVGAAVNWTSSKVELNGTTTSPVFGIDANQLAFTGGLKLDMSDTGQLETAFEVASLTFQRANGTTEDNGLSYRASARIMSEVSARTTLVPLAQYTHVDVTAEGSSDNTLDSFNLGVAAHHRVNGNDLLIMGIAVNHLKSDSPFLTSAGGTLLAGGEPGLEVERWDLPALFAALEFSVYDWLTARVGATKTVDVVNETRPTGPEIEKTESRFFFGLGLGIHFDHFDVDATVNPDAVFTGGYLFSGAVSQPLGRVTGTYYF
jgi:hypothetical protein